MSTFNSTFVPADRNQWVELCGIPSSLLTASYKHFVLDVVIVIAECRIFHLFLHRLGQHRIVSEFAIGLLVANIRPFSVQPQVMQAFGFIEVVASTTYMFVLGLEMEPLSILKPPGPDASIAYIGIFSTVAILLISIAPFYGHGVEQMENQKPCLVAIFVVMLAATSSPIVTRLATELKLSKSEIGRRAIRASLANDLVCSLLISFLFILHSNDGDTSTSEIMVLSGSIMAEILVVLLVMRPFFRHVNRRNPEGEPISGGHITIVILMTHILLYISFLFGYDSKASAFLIGLALPRDGRLSNFFISKINYGLTSFILPLFFTMGNIKLSPEAIIVPGMKTSWKKLVYVVVIATVGKFSGTLAASWYFGLHWLEAVTLAVLLNIKGYFHVFFTFQSRRRGYMDRASVLVMLFSVMASIMFAPLLVSLIVRHVRMKGGTLRLMGLQWYSPSTELRIMIGLHGPRNVPAAMSIVEMLRGGTSGGLSAKMVEMVELTEQAEASLVFRQDVDAVIVADEKVVELREQIGAALDAYVDPEGSGRQQGLSVKRILAISSFEDMHEDICCGAQDALTMLIVVPFHKTQKVDGGMDAGDLGFRTVNQNVLQRATCSVGILVDRGLGRTNNRMPLSNSLLNAAVVFTGGADDREALAYAACIARHPGIRLMVIRFLPDIEAMTMAAGPGRRILTSITDEEKEMKVDNDYFARFYQQHIENKGVGYMEKHVLSGSEAVETLRVLEGGYQLFIVGRGRDQDSVLTAGMSEWAECPELGPIGDILAASDFSVTASVLVIQQYDHTKDEKLLSDEFMPL